MQMSLFIADKIKDTLILPDQSFYIKQNCYFLFALDLLFADGRSIDSIPVILPVVYFECEFKIFLTKACLITK